MKVRIPGTNDCTKCRENLLNEYQYEVFANCVDSAACSILCMSIWALEIEGKSEEEIKQFIKDFIFASTTNKVFNKDVRVEDAMKTYSKKYGIDFDKVDLNFESKAHFMARCRRENKENAEE